MQNKYWVYKITSPSGKVYIGITSNIIKRFCLYKNMLVQKQNFIFNSIKKYGWDAHIKEILYISLTKKEAEDKEIELILFYKENKKSLNIENGGLSNFSIKDINTVSKPIYQYDLEGNFIREWESLISIELELNFAATNIGKACRRRYFYQYGYLWAFKLDVDNGLIVTYVNKIGIGRSKKLLLLNSEKILLKEYESVKAAIKYYKLKNSKRNIYQSLKFKTPDTNGNYWEYKKK